MIINNGIINTGNDNILINNTNIDFEKITEELKILSTYVDEDIEEAIEASKNKDISKLSKVLKKLKKGTIDLISTLGLTALERIIEKIIF